MKCDFVIQNLLGNYCAVSVGSNSKAFSGVINLNETGKRVFECIQQGMEVDQIVAVLLEEYDVDETTARKEAEKVVGILSKEGLLE